MDHDNCFCSLIWLLINEREYCKLARHLWDNTHCYIVENTTTVKEKGLSHFWWVILKMFRCDHICYTCWHFPNLQCYIHKMLMRRVVLHCKWCHTRFGGFPWTAIPSPGSPYLVLAIDLHQAGGWTRALQRSFPVLMFLWFCGYSLYRSDASLNFFLKWNISLHWYKSTERKISVNFCGLVECSFS